MSDIQLLVGLGNPGPEYAQTRHNAGAWYIEELARLHRQSLSLESKFSALTARVSIKGKEVRLLIPTTYMNLSGKAVGALANFYRIPVESILVAHDELDLPPGVARFKQGGGHGGHNGLKDIMAKMGNNPNFHRLRIGIGHPGDRNKVTGFVLGKAPANEQDQINAAIDEAIRATDILFESGITAAQNRLHAFKA
ncbi:aminoacyl-tRNA hydrolase [Gallaecimonas pentaromativorans]|uniref:Peptidyl-tRNA hydrolase n=1 Tax=Gallaecimonas pentaromativorans TaxID=584787 RepID=A0A3N1P3M2_9GAMM|nr:aminoacyl-tRNA hydrolase [Gallaecimonas pentaromativorans]MED5525146.1 aminoacyl-tRNA hydrolase [Pseudomonadota bacterium]ROQ22679.1 peptidyl-tRNA hydrolase [Gallaecimonas pentaromativorans]